MDLSLDRTTSFQSSQIPWGSKIWCGGMRESVRSVLGFVQSEWSTSLVGKKGYIYSVSSNMAVVVQVNGQAGHLAWQATWRTGQNRVGAKGVGHPGVKPRHLA